ncbi:ATP-binding protein [Lederbergia lenta]|uniref:histidine kinase n=1 Tax=Lederbergia lenta TaxID=1467 RepID=A0A2X4YXE8_LEDLE|nr:ATP-binding protein [Lederbergia lenta]MCM3111582.1 cell wall metabolism sensor histidine kinase WalK [Lederbergia lenta]MEC2325030.1 ATP-binding protein [Lederbergia lenta]SQI56475.1 PAS/PAC sensor signal transduction histidine kinase [Lederbergia lenta]
MRLWRSVVGKLWMTILLLVSFVLIILTMFLLEFFEKYHVNQIEQSLSDQAKKISNIIESHANDNMGEEIVFEIVDDPVGVAVAYSKDNIIFSSGRGTEGWIPRTVLLEDEDLSKVFSERISIKKELSLTDVERHGSRFENYIVAGVPLKIEGEDNGAIFTYQSLALLKETTRKTTRIILLAAGIAIVLTTIFAFFLSTRITAPLRKMKEAAFEVSKGKFDTKVPFLSHDEIGELAIAFNQMGKRLKFNMNVLSQEKEQLTSILSSMADGVMTFNQDGSILITNPPAERFLQQWHYESENESAIPTELDKLLTQAIKTEKEQSGELMLQGRYYVIIVSPLYTQNQESVRGAVAVIRDMTEERRLDKLRIDFVSNVSHELRTPISMLQGYSEAIVDDIAGSEEENKELAKIIYDESLRIGRLVNELLDLARMEAGHIHLNDEEVDIEEYIHRIMYKFKGVARDNDVILDAEIESKDLTFKLDPDKIEQVLTNLIDNAMRHTNENGTIMIVQTKEDKGITISVKDNGSGIPEEDLPFVFERFYKADKARTRGRAGTGLGLAIAKNIIEAHNGFINVQSKKGQGTTFSFFLPYRRV